MVSPAKPNSTGQTTAKTPKEPKAAPSEESLIPPDLARQNIPSPSPQKKLEESTIIPKDDLTPQDVNVTKKAKEVLGIEDSSDTDSDGLDFFDSLMEEETPPSEAVHQPEETPSEPIEDGLDFFDDLMGDSNTLEDSPSAPVEQKLHTAKDAVENLMGKLGTEIKQDVTIPKVPISLIMDIVFEQFSNADFEQIVEKATFNLNNIQFENTPNSNVVLNINKSSSIYESTENVIFTNLFKNDESIKQIHEFIQNLNLSPEKLARLRIVQLNEKQWERLNTKLTILIKQSQNKVNVPNIQDTENEQTIREEEKFSETPHARTIPVESNKLSKKLDKTFDLEKELEREFIQEEILTKERSKLRDKKAAAREHRAVEKEIENWERKHSEIKRDADARDIKRRIP